MNVFYKIRDWALGQNYAHGSYQIWISLDGLPGNRDTFQKGTEDPCLGHSKESIQV
jgi:hypothetical protein